jgi:hypothetical protein
MKKILFFIALLWMALLVPQTATATTVEHPFYNLNSLNDTNRNLRFEFEVKNLLPSDKITVTLFAGYDQMIPKQLVTVFNDTSDGTPRLKDGINHCVLWNLNPGTFYEIIFVINGVKTNFMFQTQGTPPLVGENTAVLGSRGVTLYWLYGNEYDNREFKILLDKYETFVDPSFIVDLSKEFMYDKSKLNSVFIPYDSLGKEGDVIYYKISAKLGANQITTNPLNFTIPKYTTGAVKKPEPVNFTLYPNPAKNEFTINVKENSTLLVYNTLGQQVIESSLFTGNNPIEINLDNGFYTAVITNNSGTSSKKITILN